MFVLISGGLLQQSVPWAQAHLDVIDNIFLCLIFLGAMMQMRPDVIAVGGQCWVAKMLKWLRKSRTHVFDWVATTPSVVAHILGGDGSNFLNTEYYCSRGAHGGHIQHLFYEQFVMEQTFGSVAEQMMQNELPAMFQHNTEGGAIELSATLQKRLKLMWTRLAGTQWKVLVYGFAIPWSVYKELPGLIRGDVFDCIFAPELKSLFEKLKEKGIENFALVAFIVVDGVPADEMFPQRRRVLSREFTDDYQVAILNVVPFESRRVGAHFKGKKAQEEMLGVCKQVEAVSEQFGWCEVPGGGVGGRSYFYNPSLSISVWSKVGRDGQASIIKGMIVETNADIKCTPADNGHL